MCYNIIVYSSSRFLMRSCFRYIFIEYPRHSAVYCNITRARITVALICVVTCIVCIPNFVSITVQSQPFCETSGQVMTSCGGWKVSTPASSNSTSPMPVIWVVTFKLDNQVGSRIEGSKIWNSLNFPTIRSSKLPPQM